MKMVEKHPFFYLISANLAYICIFRLCFKVNNLIFAILLPY